jgi:uncharacterized protein
VKVFLDANILFSAAKEGSLVGKLLSVIVAHGTCLTNQYAVEEAKKNISIKRYGTIEELQRVLSFVVIGNQLLYRVPVPLKDKDIPILAGAIALKSTHLLTGDMKDFGRYMGSVIEGVRIVTPKMMAEILVESGFIK